MTKKKERAMISQPMRGLTKEEIIADRDKAKAKLEKMGYEVIDTLFDAEWFNLEKMASRGIVNVPVCFLAKSIEKMSECHAVYFVKGWEDARGCKIEYEVAKNYGLDIVQ